MKKCLVIRNLDNNRFYTGRYWSFDECEKWSKEISDAKEFDSLEDIEQLVVNQEIDEDNYSDYDELHDKPFEVITIYK